MKKEKNPQPRFCNYIELTYLNLGFSQTARKNKEDYNKKEFT